MGHAYTPGLQVSERTVYRARRTLPIPGEVLVNQGDRVQARDVVAQTDLPGDIFPLNLANQLSVMPGDIPQLMLKKEGDYISEGEVIAMTNGIFGMFRTPYHSRATGTIESVSGITGQVIVRGKPIPVQVRAYASGVVSEVLPGEGCVIESQATFVQGIFGVGGEAYGKVRVIASSPDEELEAEQITEELKGCIVVGGARIHGDAARRAIECGVAAVVSGGIDDQDLRDILGYDLGVAVTGTEQLGTTVIVTEGFGDIAMADRTFELLTSREGADAAVNGATQIRAGVQRPEILIPLNGDEGEAHGSAGAVAGVLEVGAPVRIIRDPYFGVLGTVADLPTQPQVLGSGSKARVLEVACASGERVTVPRANVELIAE
ncbi:hypothetical protein [Maioricimonas sp. JC845]|uniref:hypothetical protein n=1 Tax=Maioricimonas sp. JC845 TaxID=3232138 RepID=UPI003458AE77